MLQMMLQHDKLCKGGHAARWKHCTNCAVCRLQKVKGGPGKCSVARSRRMRQRGCTSGTRISAQSCPGHGSPRQSRGRRHAPAHDQEALGVETQCSMHETHVFRCCGSSHWPMSQCSHLDCGAVTTSCCRLLANGHDHAVHFEVSVRAAMAAALVEPRKPAVARRQGLMLTGDDVTCSFLENGRHSSKASWQFARGIGRRLHTSTLPTSCRHRR